MGCSVIGKKQFANLYSRKLFLYNPADAFVELHHKHITPFTILFYADKWRGGFKKVELGVEFCVDLGHLGDKTLQQVFTLQTPVRTYNREHFVKDAIHSAIDLIVGRLQSFKDPAIDVTYDDVFVHNSERFAIVFGIVYDQLKDVEPDPDLKMQSRILEMRSFPQWVDLEFTDNVRIGRKTLPPYKFRRTQEDDIDG